MGPSANSSVMSDMCLSNTVMVLLRAWLIMYLLMLPLFLYVLHVGYRQMKNQQSAPSHSEVFTFNIVAMEILTIVSTCLYSLGIQTKKLAITRIGDDLFGMGITGQICIHSLTCVERYLAVVHPITYLRLKKRGGAMIRNTCIATAWILSAAFTCFKIIPRAKYSDKATVLCVTALSVILVSFCSISVLCVLIRPGPADRGGESKLVNQSKRRAFFTIIAIMGVLMLRCIILVSAYLVTLLQALAFDDSCLLSMAASWCYLPSSLVLPTMYLHKVGKLPKCPC